MRKTVFQIGLFLAALFSVLSCAKEQEAIVVETPLQGKYVFAIGNSNETKTTLGSDAQGRFIQWESTDKLGVMVDDDFQESTINTAVSPVTFSIDGDLNTTNILYAWYPYFDEESDHTEVWLQIPRYQTQESTGFDFDAMPMVAEPLFITDEMLAQYATDATAPLADIKFANLGSIINFKVFSTENHQSDKVKSITFDAGSSVLSGITSVNMENIDFTSLPEWTFLSDEDVVAGIEPAAQYKKSGVVKTTLSTPATVGTEKADALDVYMVVAPGSYTGHVIVETDQAYYTYTISSAKELARSGIKAFGLDLDNVTPEAISEKKLPYEESFTYSAGSFTTNTVTGSPTWSYSDDYGAKVVGNSSAATEGWLISPVIDLTDVGAAEFSISECVNKNLNNATVWIKKTTDGSYTQLEYSHPTVTSGSWSPFEERIFNITSYCGSKVTIGFKYNSTKSKYGAWEIKNFSVHKIAASTSFTISNESFKVITGKKAKNGVTVNSGASITYSSDDESVATVNESGIVTGVAEGSTYINLHVDANGDFPAKDDLYEVVVMDAPANNFSWDLSTDTTISAAAEGLMWENGGYEMTLDKSSSVTDANSWYPGGGKSSTQFSKDQVFTITPLTGTSIGYIEFTATTSGYASTLAGSSWTNAQANVDGDEESHVIVIPTDGSTSVSAVIGGAARITSVKVYYTGTLDTRTRVVLSFANSAIVKTTSESYSGQSASADPTAAASSIVYAITGDAITSAFNTSTGALTLNGTTGSATVTASIPAANLTYRAKPVSYTITVTSATGGTAEFAPSDFSGQGTSGTGSTISATVDGVTFSCNKGYGTTQIRCYSGGKITIESSSTITEISFTFSGSYTGGLETSYTKLSTNKWEKTLSSQARITALSVTYE